LTLLHRLGIVGKWCIVVEQDLLRDGIARLKFDVVLERGDSCMFGYLEEEDIFLAGL